MMAQDLMQTRFLLGKHEDSLLGKEKPKLSISQRNPIRGRVSSVEVSAYMWCQLSRLCVDSGTGLRLLGLSTSTFTG